MPNSDLISRAAALNALLMSKNYRDAHDALEQLPAVDAVPVVRCKDCIHYNNNYCGEGFGWCERKGIGHGTSDDWFCASGEAKDGGEPNADGETPLSR